MWHRERTKGRQAQCKVLIFFFFCFCFQAAAIMIQRGGQTIGSKKKKGKGEEEPPWNRCICVNFECIIRCMCQRCAWMLKGTGLCLAYGVSYGLEQAIFISKFGVFCTYINIWQKRKVKIPIRSCRYIYSIQFNGYGHVILWSEWDGMLFGVHSTNVEIGQGRLLSM